MMDEIEKLLVGLPGVSIAWKRKNRLGLKINDQRSLAYIAHVATSSNVLLVVEIDWSCDYSNQFDPDCVRYDLRFRDDDFEIFKSFLAR